ncbi:MAG TPA: FAD-dependent oxidoreductase [Phototrophicaceae bacterium]|nr:FAD-dependent oxidoreductase [Phototrophicaceae bacterium]
MHIGIVGGGLMGMALAYFMVEAGQQVTVLEQSADLGGLSGQIEFEGGLKVARYQHAILPHDDMTRRLCAEMGLANELTFSGVRTGFIHDNHIYSMSTLRDFLSFNPLTLVSRLRLGIALLQARNKHNWHTLDQIPVKSWLVEVSGTETFEHLWRPLLETKFDGLYDTVPATYIWAWLNRMFGIRRPPQFRSRVGYLRRGHYALIQALAEAITQRGGHIETQVRVREIVVSNGQLQQVRTLSGLAEFDVLVAAIATPSFARLIPGADNTYLERLAQERYLGLICPVMILDKPLSPYWTLNVIDPNSPFSTIIETPHQEQPNYHVVYLPRYTASDNDWLGVSDDDIRAAWLGHLSEIFPDFDQQNIQHFAVSRSRYVESIYSIHAAATAVPVPTPYQGLYLANTGQVYPELPTSEAVIAHARQVAKMICASQTTPKVNVPA